MATSPIYNWPEPDNTDLVKNGALAIRTLGDAIDTTMATMTPKSLVDAKGDLIAASAADTPARLAVGNNGETLVADSSTATGLRYQPTMAAGKNAIINGAFDIWQRGTSIAVNAAAYTTDRWMGYRGVAGMTVSRQSTNDTTNLPFIQYCARVQRDSGNTSTQSLQFTTPVETSNVYRYTGQTVTMSFYARCGANYSPISSALGVYLSTGTGTDGNPLAGYTGQTNTISQTATLTTTWQRFSYTATLTSTTTQMAPYFLASVTGTAGANDYFEVTGVQLELGSVATSFTRAGGTIQGELAACQRYYWRSSSGTTYTALSNFGTAISTTQAIVPLPQKVSLRATPTVLDFSNLGLSADGVSTATAAVSAAAFSNGNITSAEIQNIVVTSTGLTQFRPYALYANNSSAGYIAIGAEL